MIEFNKLKKEDFDTIYPFLVLDKTKSCEKTPVAIMMWREFYSTEWAIYKNTLIIRYNFDDETSYLTPIGENVPEVVKALGNVTYVGVCNEDIEKVASKDAEIIKDRDNFDYIYLAEDLKTFSGKKLHAKKNFLNRFKKNYQYEYIKEPDKKEMIDFFTYIDKKQPHYDETGTAELNETIDIIENRETFKAYTAAIKVDGKIIAACVGSVLDDTLYVHIEKADLDYDGSYQAIVSEFAKSFDNIEYINREDDLGEEGLRTSKLSYKPLYLLEKSHIVNDPALKDKFLKSQVQDRTLAQTT